MKNESVEIDWEAIERSDPQELHVLKTPEYSEWMCYLFGGEAASGIGWRPLKMNRIENTNMATGRGSVLLTQLPTNPFGPSSGYADR